MSAFSPVEARLIDEAYTVATERIANLTLCNERSASEIRSFAILEFQAHQQQIEALGFFETNDFSLEEHAAILEAADEIIVLDDGIEDAHDLTVIELEADLAKVIQGLGLDEHHSWLSGAWTQARLRKYPMLPKEIPAEVRDEFNVRMFMSVQMQLNFVARRLKTISDLKCLNTDDYSTMRFGKIQLAALLAGSNGAIDSYIDLQRLKAAERALKQNEPLGIGGQLWALIGWESPWDFLSDVAVTAAFGGAGVVRWARRLKKARDRIKRARRALPKLINTEERIRKIEQRADRIKKASDQIKRMRAIARAPEKLILALENLKNAEGQAKIIELIGHQVGLNYIRGVASSVAVSVSQGYQRPAYIGGAFTQEAARMAILAYFDGTPLGTRRQELRGEVKLIRIILSNESPAYIEKFHILLWSSVLREFLARAGLAVLNKRNITKQMLVDEFLASFGSALETLLREEPFLQKVNIKFIGETVISTIRKYLVAFVQRLIA